MLRWFDLCRVKDGETKKVLIFWPILWSTTERELDVYYFIVSHNE